MNDSSYAEARNQLKKMFDKQSDFRHVIFWYDPQSNFFDDIINDNFDNAKIIIYKNNPFTIKTLLEKEDPQSNYLIYFNCDRPKDVENWLLDTLLYSEEYYADVVALTMRKLGLESSKLRNVINKHLDFFNSQERIHQLQRKVDLNDNLLPEDLEMAMMATITKSPYIKLDYILKELIYDDKDEKYKALVKYNFKNIFWDLICNHFYYSGEEDIYTLAKSFLVTSVNMNKNLAIDSPIWNKLIIKDSCEVSCYFVNEILKKDIRYIDLQNRISSELLIYDLISTKGIESIKTSDEFMDFDKYIINSIVKSLSEGSYDFDFYLKVINDYRITSKWYDLYQHEYEFIKYVCLMRKVCELNIETDLKASQYIDNYCDRYYKVDNYYRHAINAFSKINNPSDKMSYLVTNLDNFYENKFLSKLGGEFSKSLCELDGNYNFGSVETSNYFFKNRINKMTKKQFVIISDALRYEVAVDLVNELNSYEKFRGSAKIEHQITTLPSITMFGMASLLPNNNDITYKNKNVYINDKATNSTEKRNNILKNSHNSYAAIQFTDVMKMTRDELRNYMNDKSLVYIYHDVIDNAGEHEFDVFEACNTAITEIVDMIKKLYNALQISTYMITSDHGFIYRNKKIEESSKYPSFASLGLQDFSQRYALISDSLELDYSNSFKLDYLGETNYKVFTPYSYDLYRKQGGGIQYIHGGASLQELVTPIVTLNAMRGKDQENLVEPVKVRLKTINNRILSLGVPLHFEQMEKVAGKKVESNINVYFIDENNNVISEKKLLIANKTTDNPNDRIISLKILLKQDSYDKNKRYYLIMENKETGKLINEPIQFIIDIPFKPYF